MDVKKLFTVRVPYYYYYYLVRRATTLTALIEGVNWYCLYQLTPSIYIYIDTASTVGPLPQSAYYGMFAAAVYYIYTHTHTNSFCPTTTTIHYARSGHPRYYTSAANGRNIYPVSINPSYSRPINGALYKYIKKSCRCF